ncbi:MAG: hypothetical protein HC871_14530 [Rhizobiales bacterium]|nr:hypothetical protein [Hyphomicrobiales bacterium]
MRRRAAAAIDPVAFHRRYLTDVLQSLDDWQVQALRDPAPNKLLLCGRQTGKSTLAALMAAHRSTMLPSRLVLLLSPTLRQSTELFRKTITLIEAVDAKPDYVQKTATQLTLANQSKVVSLPGANPDAIRGYSEPDLIIEDEAAFVTDRTFTATRPMLAASTHPTHVLMSTPYGRRGHFHERWRTNDPDWSKHTIKSEDCLRISEAFLDGERRVLSARAYRQEYECDFLESTISVFPADWIERLVDGDERHGEVLPDADLLRRIKATQTTEEAVAIMRETGMMKPDGTVSLERMQGAGGGAWPAFADERKAAVDPEARAEYCRLNNELSRVKDDRRSGDREARIAVLERNIGELRERAGIPGGPEDKSAARQSDQDDAGPVKVDPESWSAL